ncbi:hypothetical protein AMS68_006708 [Peltaster fructicola]|uniref:Purine permease n=1 Tax=Peltaster fructicola TaxID=286661 RepID=A0A6H0Y2P4_9PEZI|nr:hypothetical protein AMS68_006708 [Peltaster fructicola]
MGSDSIVVEEAVPAPPATPPEVSKQRRWSRLQELWDDAKWTFTTREGLVGDYDYLYLFTPNIWPLNRRYKDHTPPFFYPDDKIPLLLIILLGIQHGLTMISGIVSPILAVAGSGFHLDSATTEYLISAGFITSAIATFLQITRAKIGNTQYRFGTGMLSVVGPTFDVIAISIKYTALLYARGDCPVAKDGTRLPCPAAYGALLGTTLCTVWVQFLVAFLPPRLLNRLFPKVVTGCLLLLCGIYLVSTGAASWGGGSACMNGTGVNALCPSTQAPKPLPWGDPKLIGLGFATFVTIVIVEIIGSPLMKSASIIFGLAVGSIISGATGYWSAAQINQAPTITFLWTQTFKLSVDGALVLPLMIMFICEAMTCMPCILATAEMSNFEIEGTDFNSRIQGGILCDAVGTVISTLGTGLPMVSHAGNNGVIVVTNCASRRAGYCAAVVIFLMGVFGRFGAVFAAMPPSVLGGMQTFLYSTVAVAGLRVIALIPWTRRNRFILSAALGIGLLDIVAEGWFAKILTYSGDNYNLAGFEQGINLLVETPFIIGAVVAVILNAIMPLDKNERVLPGPGDSHALPQEVKLKADS